MSKKLAIIQSNYIPWKGYFDIIQTADEFILYDHVQYTTNDWRNRNQIKTSTGLTWLTIPVETGGKFGQAIDQTTVANDIWRKKHWKSIAQNYSRARHFAAYKDLFEELYLGSTERSLSRINRAFIDAICGVLGIGTRISWSTDYRLLDGKTERLVDLCKQTGSTEYVSGPSAKGYMDEALFKQEGITLSYVDYAGYPEYGQLYPPFEHKVSVIDLLFNEGPDAPRFMKGFSPRTAPRKQGL